MPGELIELAQINKNTQNNHYNTVISLASPAGVAAYADTIPVPTLDSPRDAWAYTTTAGNKMNLYMFGHQVLNRLTVNNLRGFWAVISMDTITANNCVPFLVVNTLPVSAGGTGSGGDASWYKSKRTFHINLSQHNLYNGERVLIFYGDDPAIESHIRHIRCTNTTTDGDYNLDETIWLISLHTDSAAPVGNTVLTHSMGWSGGVHNSVAKINMNLV
jgi:hypothetical protein